MAADLLVEVREAWIAVWVAASNGGGAIGFAEPVGAAEVAPLVDAQLADAASGSSTVGAVLDSNDVPVAFAVIRLSSSPVQRHRGNLIAVMVDPRHQGRGIGRLLVEGMTPMAGDLGLRQLHLSARFGLGLERFYAGLGYEEFGRHPEALKLGPATSATRSTW